MPRRETKHYEKHREREARRRRDQSAEGRDIGKLPKVANRRRRNKAEKDLEYALRTYFPKRFTAPWSDDHRKAIEILERAMNKGGIFAYAMPRRFGKSAMSIAVVILAVVMGLHDYVVLIAATNRQARKLLTAVKRELLTNELLAADFPEAVHAIRQLQGIAQRARGQMYKGKATDITWGRDVVIMPTIEGSPSSGAIIECYGLLGAIRGLQYTRADGSVARPTIALLDDPQTRRSARSEIQTEEREDIITGDMLWLGDGTHKMSAFVACTVIQKGDLADRLLDRDRNPEFQGLRTQMLYKFPTHMDQWDKYWEKRSDELRGGGDGSKATAWYRRHRKKMDEGAIVAWEQRFEGDEISALQHCMNLYYRDPDSFFAEGQNDPRDDRFRDDELLTAEQIAAKMSGFRRRQIPIDYSVLTCQIDVQKDALYWEVNAWAKDFRGNVLDYGTWPEQKVQYFTLRNLRHRLSNDKRYKGHDLSGRLFHALNDLVAHLFGHAWRRDDGAEMKLDLGLVDANWQEGEDAVYAFCRQTVLPFLPSHGIGITAKRKPFHEFKRQPGDVLGNHWRVTVNAKQALRCVKHDANWWKTKLQRGLARPLLSSGCIAQFGDSSTTPATHQLRADHLTAEYRTSLEGPYGIVDEWDHKPGKPDNHWLDTAVLGMVAASMKGIQFVSGDAAAARQAKPRKKKKRVSYL